MLNDSDVAEWDNEGYATHEISTGESIASKANKCGDNDAANEIIAEAVTWLAEGRDIATQYGVCI